MPSKIVSALAAGGLLVATSSALAASAPSHTLPAVSSAALLQSGAEETGMSTAIIIGGVLAAIGLLIWATGDDDAPEAPPVSP